MDELQAGVEPSLMVLREPAVLLQPRKAALHLYLHRSQKSRPEGRRRGEKEVVVMGFGFRLRRGGGGRAARRG